MLTLLQLCVHPIKRLIMWFGNPQIIYSVCVCCTCRIKKRLPGHEISYPAVFDSSCANLGKNFLGTMVFDVFGCSQHEQSAVEGAQAEAGARLAQASVASIQACIEAKASVDTQCCTENFNITVAFINVIVLAVLIYYVLWLKWKTQELNPFLLPSKGYEDEYEDESLSVDHMRELMNIPTLDLTKGTLKKL